VGGVIGPLGLVSILRSDTEFKKKKKTQSQKASYLAKAQPMRVHKGYLDILF